MDFLQGKDVLNLLKFFLDLDNQIFTMLFFSSDQPTFSQGSTTSIVRKVKY